MVVRRPASSKWRIVSCGESTGPSAIREDTASKTAPGAPRKALQCTQTQWSAFFVPQLCPCIPGAS